MTYARENRSIYIEEAEKLKEEVEDLMLIKSLMTGATLTVRVADYTWTGSVTVMVNLDGVDNFRIDVNSQGYLFVAEGGIVKARLSTLLKRDKVRFKEKEPMMQMIRKYVV